jgi:hypothetical protein
MANLADSPTESTLTSEDDDALDPRVQVCDFSDLFFIFLFNSD